MNATFSYDTFVRVSLRTYSDTRKTYAAVTSEQALAIYHDLWVINLLLNDALIGFTRDCFTRGRVWGRYLIQLATCPRAQQFYQELIAAGLVALDLSIDFLKWTIGPEMTQLLSNISHFWTAFFQTMIRSIDQQVAACLPQTDVEPLVEKQPPATPQTQPDTQLYLPPSPPPKKTVHQRRKDALAVGCRGAARWNSAELEAAGY